MKRLLDSLTEEFPIFSSHPGLIYLDSAATTQKPRSVIDRISHYYSHENANVHRGIYDLSETATQGFEESRVTVARFIGAQSPHEVIFTSGTTECINLVCDAWAETQIGKGDTIMTSIFEHHANFIPWQQLAKRKKNSSLIVLDIDDSYRLDLGKVEEKLCTHKPKLLALSHISNTLGTILPIKEIVRIKNSVSPDTKILLDAAQSVAHIPLHVSSLGIDFLAFSGHKLYGPTGIGVLWVRESILAHDMIPVRYGGGMIRKVVIDESEWADIPSRFEAGTPNIAGVLGLAEAIRFVEKIGFDAIDAEECVIVEYALEKFHEVPGLRLLGPSSKSGRSGVFSFTLEGIHPHDIAHVLNEKGIAVRAGHHCTMPLHTRLSISSSVRASIGLYSTKHDIDRLIHELQNLTKLFEMKPSR